ncbi:PDR/VanB family oxidoreductase [Nocardioides alkalitolerans]|uniref:PDR/VanB family oxidoreductase n=1 Tax=Nocardioides alkalitolerans TaxID=281714 RepID=UPI00048C556F|nr:PDR/VanB family oxidoreductase [Nocardioides alkalitolerans]
MSAPAVERAVERYPAHLHPAYATGVRSLRVVEVVRLTDTVRHVVLEAPDGGVLASYEPGAHLVVTTFPEVLPTEADQTEKRNAYSLTGDGVNPRRYAVSVLRRGDGGGSDWVHDALAVGDLVEVEGPRSSFAPRHDQRHALLVAGGIGVTPVLSHARAVVRWGGTCEIVYSYRPGHGAHLEDLRALAARPGVTLHEATTVEHTARVLAERFADQPLGTHAYACGPVPMLDAYVDAAAAAGWPEGRVHLERFTAPELDAGVPFTATVASTGQRLAVPPGTSLLTALLDAGHEVANLCRQGVCGECLVPVRSGALEHRDLVLSESEKSAGDRMLSCVSRGGHAGAEIEVDL